MDGGLIKKLDGQVEKYPFGKYAIKRFTWNKAIVAEMGFDRGSFYENNGIILFFMIHHHITCNI